MAGISIYYALVQSHLTYGILAWGKIAQSNLRRILSLQKKAVKIIHPDRSPTNHIINKIMSFEDLFRFHSLCKIFKCLTAGHSDHFCSNLQSLRPNHQVNTRHTNNNAFNVPYHRCNRSQQSFLYHAVNYWNLLPDSIKRIPEFLKFKNAIKNEIRSRL